MVPARERINQFLGISVKRMFEKGIRFVYLYGLAVVHHHHAVTHETDHAQIVGDEDIGKVAFFFQAVE